MTAQTAHKQNPPSNRSFGFLVAGIFAILSGYAHYRGAGALIVFGWLFAGVVDLLVVLLCPQVLTPFNRAWFKLGELLGKIVSPVVLGVIFFVLIAPVGLIARMLGRDELRLKRRPCHSYWVNRDPLGPAPDSFKNQF